MSVWRELLYTPIFETFHIEPVCGLSGVLLECLLVMWGGDDRYNSACDQRL